MWSDNESETDLLNFGHLKKAARTIIDNDGLHPTTIGVFGDWGSGKTSLLKMLKSDIELEAGEEVLCLEFNGWLFEGYEDAKAALLGTIVDELLANRGTSVKVKEKVGELLKRLDFLKTLGYVAKGGLVLAAGGLPALGIVAGAGMIAGAQGVAEKAKDLDPEKAAGLLKEDSATNANIRRTVRGFRHEFEELLKAANLKRLVVIIDDLDRCSPDTIIETLEAIKLFLFVPQTVFIIGADERLIQYAVRKRFPELPGEKSEVGRDYLEKLVQFPIRVPPLGSFELETYINLLFLLKASISPHDRQKAIERSRENVIGRINEPGFNHAVAQDVLGTIPDDLNQGLIISEQIAPALAAGLSGNPRQTKRFLNTLLLRSEMAKSRGIELKRGVLAKLMLLEYMRDSSFKALANLQAQEDGKPKFLADMEKGDVENRVEGWTIDDWTRNWLNLSPALASEDLRPYFFFSRDIVGALGGSGMRLSPTARLVLSNLLSAAQAIRTKALTDAKALNEDEATQVLGALDKQAHVEEDIATAHRHLSTMIDLGSIRPSVFAQVIALLEVFPEAQLPPSIVPKLLAAAEAIKSDGHLALIERWKKSSNNTLSRAANRRPPQSK